MITTANDPSAAKRFPDPRDEPQNVVYPTARLMLWFAWHHLQHHPTETMRHVLRHRVNLFRMTGFYDESVMNSDHPDFDVPGWIEIEEAAADRFAEHRHDPNGDRFEARAFELFRPALDARLHRKTPDRPDFSHFQAGCLRYNPIPDSPGTIALHIGNPLRPRSIFDDPLYLPRCLLSVLEQSAAELGAEKLHCGTWLNSHPRWLALFPEQCKATRSAPDENIQWHLGFWGQFVNARGGFHAKNAAHFRATGRLPFPFRQIDGSFQALYDHLVSCIS